MSEVVKVGMADLNICHEPDKITTLALGSCVGIAIWDERKKIGGLAHIMLPDSASFVNQGVLNIPKFADAGIDELVKQMVSAGANANMLKSKIAGGANMFATSKTANMGGVGERNVEAVKIKLRQLRIPILAEETGDSYGRTVIFDPSNGQFIIKAAGREVKVI